ncbi:MAG: DUF503 domain-containing protein [Bacillota bacterium]
MVVGSCYVSLAVRGSESLKDKRRVVKSLIERVKNRYNGSMAEVDHQDNRRLAGIGLAVVAGDGDFAREVLEEVVRFIEGDEEAEMLDYRVELL